MKIHSCPITSQHVLRWWTLLAAALLALVTAGSATGADFMFRARVDGRMLEGQPLAWTASQVLLLGRDGQLHDFQPDQADEAQKTSPRFTGYSTSEMKRRLYEEFDQQFEITTTRHYVVVHPRGQSDQWAERFEQLYRSFVRYFRVRGFSPAEPKYPLVAVVLRDQTEYYRYASAAGTALQPNMLGHYDPSSNRVLLFDVTADVTGGDWSQNADTIIHEATHQTAYNTGIHARFADAPRWVVEGLATMFEARGVWNSQSADTQADRLNRGRLRDFQDYAATRRPAESLGNFLASDQSFRSDPGAAYAEAWALSFYLSETRPRLYAEYLEKTAERPTFSKYSPAERLEDFQDVFGPDLRMLEVKFLRYMEEIK